jgi:hypothetical protein
VAGQASQRRPSRFQSRISPRDGLSRPVLRISTAAYQIPDYDGPRENARAILHPRLQRGDDPAKVAGLILRIVRAPARKLRYRAGHDGRWIPHLKTLIPQRTFDRLLRRSSTSPTPTTTKTCQNLDS